MGKVFRTWTKSCNKNELVRILLQHVSTPKQMKEFRNCIHVKKLVTHDVFDKAFPPPDELGRLMKANMSKDEKTTVQSAVKGVCKAGPCDKC